MSERESTSRGVPERILVLGPPGGGKTTLARTLADRTGLPLLDLDEHYWLPGWRRRTAAEWLARQRELVARPKWIISGNYQPSLRLRAVRAEAAVIVAPGPVAVLRRLLRRTVRRVLGDVGSLPPALRDAPRWRSSLGLTPLVRIALSYERRLLPETRSLLDHHRVPHLVVGSVSQVDDVLGFLGGAR